MLPSGSNWLYYVKKKNISWYVRVLPFAIISLSRDKQACVNFDLVRLPIYIFILFLYKSLFFRILLFIYKLISTGHLRGPTQKLGQNL